MPFIRVKGQPAHGLGSDAADARDSAERQASRLQLVDDMARALVAN
ncbi:hypothetical protein ACFOLB_15105 [Microbacterium aurantiacum]